MGTFRKLLTNSRGETLLTVLVSGLLILGVFFIAAPAITNQIKGQKKQLSTPSICENFSSNLLNKIRANGVQTKVYRVPIGEESVRLDDSHWQKGDFASKGTKRSGVLSEDGLPSALKSKRWPPLKAMAWNDGKRKFISHSPKLIYGSMNLLSTIYNSYTNQVCGQPYGMMVDKESPLYSLISNDFMEDYKEGGFKVLGSIRIRPFDYKTGKILNCQSPLKVRPYAKNEPPLSQQMNFTDFTQYSPEFGFEVEIFGSVTSLTKEGQETSLNRIESSLQPSCSVVERFQYDLRSDGPNSPNVTLDASGAEIAINNLRSGTFLACSYSASKKQLIGYAAMPGWSRNYWGPCDKVEICGSAGKVKIEESDSNLKIKVESSFPSDCLMNLKAIAFDGVGNTSPTAMDTYPTTSAPSINTLNGPTSGRGHGYEVGGVEFSSFAAAQNASVLTGLSVNSLSHGVTGFNDTKINELTSSLAKASQALKETQSTLSSANSVVGGLNGAPPAPTVSAARAAVNSATAAVENAKTAAAKAAGMSAMGAIGEVASSTAEDMVSEAQAAKEEAEKALEAAENNDDESGVESGP